MLIICSTSITQTFFAMEPVEILSIVSTWQIVLSGCTAMMSNFSHVVSFSHTNWNIPFLPVKNVIDFITAHFEIDFFG